jgi:hypothetical protein
MIGHNLIDLSSDDNANSNDNEDEDDDDDGGFLDGLSDDISDRVDDLRGDVEDQLNDITGDVADRLADALGISEWYSIHIQAACEGQYEPNATDPSPSLNVTNCSGSTPTCK